MSSFSSLFRRKVYGKLPLWLLLSLAIGPFVARANIGVTVVLPGTITVSYGEASAGFMALSVLDQSCGSSISQATFPMFTDPTPGITSSTTICVRNTGNTVFQLLHPGPSITNNSITFQALPVGITGDWSASANPLMLSPGAQGTIILTLTSDGTVPRDSYPFKILITAFRVTA